MATLDEEAPVRESWVGRAWQWAAAIFRSTQRSATAEERSLRRQVNFLTERLEEARAEARDLREQVDIKDARLRVGQVSQELLALEIERLRKCVEAGIAIEARRIAEHTRAQAGPG